MSTADANDNIENDQFVMNKFSRQVGEIGVAAMAKLVKSKILIAGLKGVGIEVAKNLVISGVGSLTLFDDDEVKISDLGTNFYLKESDVGTKRVAEATLPHLKALNPTVNISVLEKKLTNRDVKQFDVVVDCNMTWTQSKVCNKFCRRYGKKYIKADVFGVFGFVFVDFGEKFVVNDRTGEQPNTRVIGSIDVSSGEEDEIIVHLLPPPDGKVHGIDFDDHHGFVKFDEIEGELGAILNNTKKSFPVRKHEKTNLKGKTVMDAFALRVVLPPELKARKATEGLPAFVPESSGSLMQVKEPVTMTFDDFETSNLCPIAKQEGGMRFTDGTKFGVGISLHIALNGIWKFQEEYKRMPTAHSKKDMDKVLLFAEKFNETLKPEVKVEEVEKNLILELAAYAESKFQPLCCFLGGVVAQEAVKLSGKYTPLDQWLHIDCLEVLPHKFNDSAPVLSNREFLDDHKPLGTRYDDMIRVIGKSLHRKLMSSSTFMVGCGALGCELLKNFALIGLACDEEKGGLITVTDNDQIELSNLSRQFLFREHNVGQPKSIAASDSVREMNPSVNLKPLELLVSPDTEDTFDSKFWKSQDFITNALDNVKARLYVDSKCVFFEKPLLESGTLGTKCNSQVIVPHLTASYADGPSDDVGDSIPMCTLRNFPSTIEHCIEWARAQFTDVFEAPFAKVTTFLNDPEAFVADLKAKTVDLGKQNKKGAMLSGVATELPELEKMLEILRFAANPSKSYEHLVEQAYALFHVYFRNRILSLQRAHPEDDVDEDGHKFWSGTKRYPASVVFDATNPTHLQFVHSMANVLSINYGVFSSLKELPKTADDVVEIVSSLAPPEVEIEAVNMADDENEDLEAKKKQMQSSLGDEDHIIEKFEGLIKELVDLGASSETSNLTIEPASFEKDDDENFHIDFITATSNLRAENYRIKPVSRHKAKLISGKIIPALATTTAAVTGLVTIELLKVIQKGKKLEAFKDSSNTLAVNGYFFSEPATPVEEKDEYDVIEMAEVKCLPPKFTKWRKLEVKGNDLTLTHFLLEFSLLLKTEFKVDAFVTSLAPLSAKNFFYDRDAPGGESLLEQSLKDALIEKYGLGIVYDDCIRLLVSVQGEDETVYKVPEVVYYFNG